MSETTSPALVALPAPRRRLLIEAKQPDPEKFVPVFNWDDKKVWVWAKQPGGVVIGPVDVPHAQIKKKYALKLGWLPQAMPIAGQIDPTTYTGPKDIYPLDWKPGTPLPVGPPGKQVSPPEVKFKPPKMPKAMPAQYGVPSDMKPAGKDPNGHLKGEVIATGEIYSILPPGGKWKFGDWSGGDNAYYPVFKDSSGEYDVDYDAPMISPQDIAHKKAPEPPPEPPKPPPAPEKAKSAKAATSAAVGAAKKGIKKALAKAAKDGKVPSTKKGKPSTKPETEHQIVAPTPEEPPSLTKYTGKVDANGLPLVDEVIEWEEGATVSGYTLLPDDRVARWSKSGKFYRVFDYNPAHGFTPSSSSGVVLPGEAKQLLKTLSLAVVKGRYHKVTTAGAAKAAPTPHTTAVPEHTKLLPGKKDLNGFQMVQTVPFDVDDPDAEEEGDALTLLPDGRVARWQKKHKKYLVWKWQVDYGMGDFYPTHPTKFVTLKEAQKLQAQAAGSAPTPQAPVPKPKVAKPKAAKPTLVMTGKQDQHGYPLAKFGTSVIEYSLLPDKKVGVWSPGNGGYILHKLDPAVHAYYNTGDIWTPPGKHSSMANSYDVDDGLPLAKLKDTAGNVVVVLPNGKFGQLDATGNLKIQKADPTKGLVFEPTGEMITKADVKAMGVGQYKKMKPKGEVDVNGLPLYVQATEEVSQKGGFSLLPNGDWAVWSSSTGKYLRMEYNTADAVWETGTPTQWFDLDDIKAMYLKAGAESAAPPDEEQEYMSPAPMLTGKKGAHGFPFVKLTNVADSAEVTVTQFPDGKLGKFMISGAHTGEYRKVAFDPADGKWHYAEPAVYYKASDFKAPEPQTTSTATLAAPEHLTPTGETDKNGFVTYKADPPGADPEHVFITVNDKVYKWVPLIQKYRLMQWAGAKIDDEWVGQWEVVQPLQQFSAEELGGAGAVAATPTAPEHLTLTGETDFDGLPIYKSTAESQKDVDFFVHPNGDVYYYNPGLSKYQKVYWAGDSWATEYPKTYASAAELGGAAAATGTPQGPGAEDLEDTGTTDVNGLPLFKSKAEGLYLTLLPNGKMADWLSSNVKYKEWHYETGMKEWFPVDPVVLYSLSDVEAMKGAPPIPATVEPPKPAFEPAPVAAPAKVPPSLKPLGTTDPNGYPLYRTAYSWIQKREFTLLPDGTVAAWLKSKKKYREYKYTAWKQMWKKTSTLIALSEIGAAPGAPAPVSAAPGAAATAVTPPAAPPSPPSPTTGITEPISSLTKDLASKLPDPTTLKYLGSGASFGMGGAGKKDVYEDPATGRRYIFKPSIPKGGKKTEAFRAHAQEASAALALMIRPEHIPVKTVKMKGQLGTLQPWVDLAPEGTLSGVAPETLTPQQQKDVATDHMMDWLLSQHDTYSGNMVMTKSGRVLSIDKEQGFKFFGKDKLSSGYNPNPIEPYYNKFWRAFVQGKVDFDPKELLTALIKIENIDSKDYVDMVRAYAKDRFPKSERKRDRFLSEVLHRKLHLRSDWEEFLSGLYEKRTGEEGAFTFDEGWLTEKEKQKVKYKNITYTGPNLAKTVYGIKEYAYNDPKTMQPDPDAGRITLKLSKETSSTKLLDFLKEIGVEPLPVFEDQPDPRINTGSAYHMVVVDEDQYKSATVTKKVLISEAYMGTPDKPKYWPQIPAPADREPNVEEFAQLDKVEPGREGHGIMHGGSAVEGQAGKGKKWKDAKGTYYLIHFKLRRKMWQKIQNSPKTSHASYTFHQADFDPEFGGFVEKPGTITTINDGVAWTHKGTECFLATGEGQYAYMGAVYIKVRDVPASQVMARAKEALNAAVEGAGTEVFKNPTKDEREVMRLMRLLWAKSPKKAHAMPESQRTVEGIRAALKASHVSAKDIDSVYEEEVFKGYHSHILPGRWKKMKDVRFVFNGIGSMESAVSILKSGLMSIHERNLAGIPQFGGSYSSDVGTGSADGILGRVVGKAGAEGSYSFGSHSFSGMYQAIIHPSVLDRLNTYMYNSDTFGKAHGSTFKNRSSVESKVAANSKTHHTGNEISFRRGLHLNKILRIATSSEQRRKALISAARQEGIEEINGVPIDDYVVVVSDLGEAYNKYVKPLLGV
jgi:hypothetical protein